VVAEGGGVVKTFEEGSGRQFVSTPAHAEIVRFRAQATSKFPLVVHHRLRAESGRCVLSWPSIEEEYHHVL
jgi:hypothetical protein